MSVFVSQLVEKMIEILFPHGVSERERELIEEAVIAALAARYVDSCDFNLPEIIERIAGESVDNLSEEDFDALTDSVAEPIESRFEDIVREEVEAVLRRLPRNPDSDD
jgi:hypothetical protein